ncbi:hypothetical protein AGOR_G00002430 [Albula goreensis]|uniref:Ricin B lectin domain-containing protein n=1 Tax=Albula goreensis TaxID=1534307 RepID=A0A8T3E3Z7_9TELE|nr:hypothetical protein AGOR_G00002430 [Albula goreensis]
MLRPHDLWLLPESQTICRQSTGTTFTAHTDNPSTSQASTLFIRKGSHALIRMLLTWIVYCVLLQVVYSMEIHGPHHRQCLQDSLQNQTLQLRSCDTTLDFQSWAWEDGHFLVNKGSGRCLSGKRTAGVFTTPCGHSSVLHWRCHGDRLTGLGGSVELWRDGSVLLLSPRSGPPRRGSIGHRDACKAELRSGRVSRDLKDQQPGGAKRNQQGAAMGAEAQMAFLKWYYRTEDPSSWKYAMLAMSFGALLLGSVLLAISVMANRSRRKLAQYKAAALAVQMEELQDLMVTQPCTIPPKEEVPAQADAPKDTQTPHNSQTTQESEPHQINEPLPESQAEPEPLQESAQTGEITPTVAVTQETDENVSQ